MRLILVRHGESTANVQRIHNAKDEPLTERGIEQARRVADRLKREHFDRVISSPLPRAKMTAETILAFHPHVHVTFDERIRERDNGVVSGMPWGTREAEASRLGIAHDAFAPDGGESSHDLYRRVMAFAHELDTKSTETVLVVSHGGPIALLVQYLVPGIEIDRHTTKNCSVTVVDTNAHPRQVLTETDHLD